jgi:hypothetical protein
MTELTLGFRNPLIVAPSLGTHYQKEHLEKVYTERKKQFLKNGQSTDARGLDYRRTQDVQT